VAASKRLLPATWIAIIIYAVGLTGFLVPELQAMVVSLTPINILFALFLALLFHRKWDAPFVFAGLLIALCGWLLEVAGVHSGLIFGSYTYGKTLGYSVLAVPLILGANWFMLVYFTRSVVSGWFKDPGLISVVAAAMMTGFDFLLEPVAMRFDFWSWTDGIIPTQNYIAWFFAALLIHYAFLKAVKMQTNPMAGRLLLMQAVFFAVLYAWVRVNP
jgi:uncharacterized membrane protein